MRGEKFFTILCKLAEGAVEINDLFTAFLDAGYGASVGRMEYAKGEAEARRMRATQEQKERQKFYNTLYKLNKQGLVHRMKTTDKIGLTARGRKRIRDIKERKEIKSLPDTPYPAAKSASWILVSFDIPEKERYKRDWLRRILIFLGFRRIQQSVFIGQIKIPEELLDDLRDLALLDAVVILEIKQSGTLKIIQ